MHPLILYSIKVFLHVDSLRGIGRAGLRLDKRGESRKTAIFSAADEAFGHHVGCNLVAVNVYRDCGITLSKSGRAQEIWID